ncbi:MAG TPA: hypothetical protein VGW33_09640 [Terriglobia bacterium]|nr:hypothetical protein [Terriglobia bacterium]
MLNARKVAALSLLSLTVGAPAAESFGPRHTDTEADLTARIAREHDPVKKAKYEIRLGELKLQQATDAYDRDETGPGEKLLGSYLDEMKDAWKLLKGSGRDAVRKPAGFKELDIALREDARRLDDLRRRVPFMDRGPLDKVMQEVNQTHAEVLTALFPAGRSKH